MAIIARYMWVGKPSAEEEVRVDIKQLFDPSKDIYRTIEKVITYGAAQEHRLKAEISEYGRHGEYRRAAGTVALHDAGGHGDGR